MIQYAPETFLCVTFLTFSASANCHINIPSPTIYSTIPIIYGAPVLCPVSVPRRKSDRNTNYSKFWLKKTNRI
jgi:hypothetical protein